MEKLKIFPEADHPFQVRGWREAAPGPLGLGPQRASGMGIGWRFRRMPELLVVAMAPGGMAQGCLVSTSVAPPLAPRPHSH